MEINGVSKESGYAMQMQQSQRASESHKTEKADPQSQHLKVNNQQKTQEVAQNKDLNNQIMKNDKSQQADTQGQYVAKQIDSQTQLLKRMELQSAMHPVFYQVHQQQNLVSKTESAKEATKVVATGETNTGKR
jgi:hypothetical protein